MVKINRNPANSISLTFLLLINELLFAASEAGTKTAVEILTETKVESGLVVHIGCGDGQLTAALYANDRYFVYGFDSDMANVTKARGAVRKVGRSVSVWVDHLAGSRLPFAGNMVNLLVSEYTGNITMKEILRVLVPNGVAYIKQEGKWTKTIKPWSANIDQWSHWLHGPDGNAVSKDLEAGPPRRLKWVAAPFWTRSHDHVPGVTSMVSANGRLFYIVDEAPASVVGDAPDKWVLVGRDAYNGLDLWRIPMPQWGWKNWSAEFSNRFNIPTHMPSRLVAVGDRVYVTLGFNAPLSEINAATGKILRTFDNTEFTDEILFVDGKLILSINKEAQRPGSDTDKGTSDSSNPIPAVRKSVAVIDAASGKMLWKKGDYLGLRSKTGSMERISHLSMVAGDGQIYFVDGNEIIALAFASGEELWRTPRPIVEEKKIRYNIRITDMCSLVYHDNMLYFTQLNPDRRIDWREVRAHIHAFSADSGKEVWSRECSSWGWGHPADIFIFNDLVWVSGFNEDFYLGLDCKTGELKDKISNYKAFDNGHHHRCYRNKATTRYFLTSYRGLEFIDSVSGETSLNHWVRGSCRLGPMPSNGMVYTTPHPCSCYISSKLNGFLGLIPASKDEVELVSQSGRLIKGPAYSRKISAENLSESKCWPSYRHDSKRSGATSASLPANLETLWTKDFGQTLTSPIVAGDKVFAALKDAREIIAINSRTSKVFWRYTAGGRIDTPPTYHNGRVVFGSTDGYVYCLSAKEGDLIWQFRASPRKRIIGAFGGLESPWPVYGSVLIEDDTVYCTAGRSSFLDDGIFAWALDIKTGSVVSSEVLSSDHDMKPGVGNERGMGTDTGVLSDLLVAHNDSIYLRQRKLFGSVKEGQKSQHLLATAGLLDNSWFHRTRWFLGGVPLAEYLVFDDTTVCGIRVRNKISSSGGHFQPATKGFQLFSAPLEAVEQKVDKSINGSSGIKTVGMPFTPWRAQIPIRVTAMAIANKTMVVAGSPDVLCPDDPWAAYEGRSTGKLIIVSIADAKVLTRKELPSPAILDGLAVADDRLFISTADGKLICLGAKAVSQD